MSVTSPVEYWRCDEASGARAGRIIPASLADNNTVGSGAGNLSALAALFDNTASEYLSSTHATIIGVIKGGGSWTVGAWINPTNVASTRLGILGTFDAGFSGLMAVRRSPDAGGDGVNVDSVYWQFWNDAASPSMVEVSGTSGRTIAGQWSMVACRYNHTTGTMAARTNGATSADTTVSGTFTANDRLRFGQRGDNNQFYKGRMGHIFLYNSALSDADLDTLYNSGNGYDPTASQPKGLAAILAHRRGIWG